MYSFTTAQLKSLFPYAQPTVLVAITPDSLKQGGLTTAQRARHFLAQMAHESVGFKYLHELGGRKYFQRYEGRTDLGNVKPGDGYKYRGRGIIQLTGRTNYAVYGKKLGLDLINDPDLASRADIALKIALQYWNDKKLNNFADANDIKTITKRINGGYNGLQDRINWYTKIGKIL